MPAESPVPTRLRDRFAQLFGAVPEALAFGPGRINLVGAHLDYSGGDVVPLAVDLGVFVAGRRRHDGVLRLVSLDQELQVERRVDAVGDVADPGQDWARYPLGVWAEVRDLIGEDGAGAGASWAQGFDLLFGGDLPMASGMSSSAAIEVATAVLFDHLLDLGLTRRELALLCHRAETRYAGVQCGIMDQFASALGKPGHALLLHCHNGEVEPVEILGRGFEVLVMDTMKPRQLADVGFNERVAECAAAHDVLRREVRDLPYLAAYSPEDAEQARAALGHTLFRRARHVTTEMGRVARGVAGLRAGRIEELGKALTESHRSTSVDYHVSCAELDAITSAACELPQTFGARLTGAGFGGCAIALIEDGSAAAVGAHVARRYRAQFGVEPDFRVLHAGGGPQVLPGVLPGA